FVARMITPLIAAYFLRSKGIQPHANWKWMDFYLRVLNWSLDTTKADALLARLPKPARKLGYYALGALILLILIIAFFAGTMLGFKVFGLIDGMISLFDLPGVVTFGLSVFLGAGVAYLAAKL